MVWILVTAGMLTGLYTVRAQPDPQPRQWIAWAAYWATEGVADEAQKLGDSLQGLSLFAAYYDSKEQLFIPEELTWLQEDLGQAFGRDVPLLLTIVNDRLVKGGKPTLKDRDLLWRKLGTQDARVRHAKEIIALAQQLEVKGIELDYENLGKDTALWQYYAVFIDHMQAEAMRAGLSLSVVLEPSVLDVVSFPEGPSYVVMLYNLYGNHSGPGPKADLAFIKRLAAQMKEKLPGCPAVALAADGFIWHGNGEVESLTEKEAVALARDMGVKVERDNTSGALHFEGILDGTDIHVWYADGETLSAWAKAAESEGIDSFYLWLLGGKEERSLDRLK